MKNKILILGIIVILIVALFTLTGCGNNNKENGNSADTTNKINEAKEVDGEVEKLIKNYYKYYGEKNADEIAKLFDLAKVKEKVIWDLEKKYHVTIPEIQDVYKYLFENGKEEDFQIEVKEILKLENSDDIDAVENKILELDNENENSSESVEKDERMREIFEEVLNSNKEFKIYGTIYVYKDEPDMLWRTYFVISEDNKIIKEALFEQVLSYYISMNIQGNTENTSNIQSSATDAIKAGPYSLKYGKYTDKYGTTYTLNSDGTYTCKSTESGGRYSSSGTYIIYNLAEYKKEINQLNEPLGISGEWFIALNYDNKDISEPYLMSSYNIKADNEFYFGQTDEVWTYQGN